jgi:uncharacterized protein YndB with AHSA1/START domain
MVVDSIHGTVSQEIVVAVPPAVVWSAFADADFRGSWFSLPGDRNSRSHELDFRVGGEELTRSTFNNIDHLERLELRSRLLDIDPQRRITATSTFRLNEVVRIVTISSTTFEPTDEGTRVSFLEQYQCFGLVGDGSGDQERGEREGGTRFMLRRLSIALEHAASAAKS